MSSDLVWIMVAINVALGAGTILNAWALAWYNNKIADEREGKETPAPNLARKKRGTLLPGAMALVSLAGLGLSVWLPSANVNEQIFRISFFVGSCVLAIVLWLVSELLRAMWAQAEHSLEHWKITRRVVAIVEKIAASETKDGEP